MVDRYLALAVAIHEEHEVGLWTKMRTRTGHPYESEDQFWEEAIGLKRRTAYQLIAVGRVLSKVGIEEDGMKALAGVGLYKMDLLVPVLEREPTQAALQKWVNEARSRTRDELRELVHEALGQPARSSSEPGARFAQMVERAMPDEETRKLTQDFFRVGKLYVGTENAVGVAIAAMQECLGTWSAHTSTSQRLKDRAE
jgi:hypothetical protein